MRGSSTPSRERPEPRRSRSPRSTRSAKSKLASPSAPIKDRAGKRRARRRPALRRRLTYAIDVTDNQTHRSIPAASLRQIARTVLAAEGVSSATISIALVDDAIMRRLNRRHLDHDYATDVLSFLFDADQDSSALARSARTRGRPDGDAQVARPIDGEVVISVETAVRSAPRFGSRPEAEIALYLVHGLLHLCGYLDHAPADRRLMRKREREILKQAGIDPERRPRSKRSAGPAA